MQVYIVYVNGDKKGMIRAGSHDAAEKKAKKLYPNKNVDVAYTEI